MKSSVTASTSTVVLSVVVVIKTNSLISEVALVFFTKRIGHVVAVVGTATEVLRYSILHRYDPQE